MSRTPHASSSAAVPPIAWLVGESPLSMAHLRTWNFLAKTSASTVLAQVPVAWIMARVGQVASAEARCLPRVDFVVCDRKAQPVLAVQLVRGAGLESRRSAAEVRRTKQMVALLSGLPLRTLAWDTDAPMTPVRLKEQIAAVSGGRSGAPDFTAARDTDKQGPIAEWAMTTSKPEAGSAWSRLRQWLLSKTRGGSPAEAGATVGEVWEIDDGTIKLVKAISRRLLAQAPQAELAMPAFYAVTRQLSRHGIAGLPRLPTGVLTGATQELLRVRPERQEAQTLALLMVHLQGLVSARAAAEAHRAASRSRSRPAQDLDIKEVGMSAFIDAEQAWAPTTGRP